MSESIAAVIRGRRDTMRPGEVYMLNTPYNGGTHLPDVTVVRPVFDEGGRRRYSTSAPAPITPISAV